MSRFTEDIDDQRAKLQFFDEIERSIRIVNQEVIHARIPELNRESAIAFAVSVARLRASYLDAAMQVCANGSGEAPDVEAVEDLRRKREVFEEARTAYEALRHAIDVGYIDIGQLQDDAEAEDVA